MKLSTLIDNLKAVYMKHGDLECVYAADDEGNWFQPLYYGPTVGCYEDDMFTEVYKENINAVCIN